MEEAKVQKIVDELNKDPKTKELNLEYRVTPASQPEGVPVITMRVPDLDTEIDIAPDLAEIDTNTEIYETFIEGMGLVKKYMPK